MANPVDARKTVTTAGTRVQFSASRNPVQRVIFQALPTNTGAVVIGGPGVVAASSTRSGFALISPGDWWEITTCDLFEVWMDAETSGEGVSYVTS